MFDKTLEKVIVSGQVRIYERVEKLNTLQKRQNSGTHLIGEDRRFFGISLFKGHGIAEGSCE